VSGAGLQALPNFVPAFVQALGTNLRLAAQGFALGLPVGVALALLRWLALKPRQGLGGRLLQVGAGFAVVALALLRSAPAFVVMYFLAHAVPAAWAVSPQWAVAGSLAAFAAAYTADQLLESLVQGRAGVPPLVSALVRAYAVMVLSSGFGAALGVQEATSMTLRTLEQLPTLADRLVLMGVVMAFYMALLQSLHAAAGALGRRLAR
jgi:hypothetical protein